MTTHGESLFLAEGILDWRKDERKTDRYGSVNIQTAGHEPGEFQQEQLTQLLERARERQNESRGSMPYAEEDVTAEHASFENAPIGMMGRLAIEVTQARDSHHVGDVHRSQYPTTPEVGERIELGHGELFVEKEDDVSSIGVKPTDGRAQDWMDPSALYRAHNQTVKLYFEPESA